MDLQQIDIIDPQPLQRSIDRVEDRRPRQPALIHVVLRALDLRGPGDVAHAGLFTHGAVALGQDDELLARDGVFLDAPADHFFGDAVGIDVRGVPGVEAAVVGAFEEGEDFFFGVDDPFLPVFVAEGLGRGWGQRLWF
jgi:hypothetical protein